MKKNLSFKRLLTFVSIVSCSLMSFPLIPIFIYAIPITNKYFMFFTVINPILAGIGYVISQIIGKWIDNKKILQGVLKVVLTLICLAVLVGVTELLALLLCLLGAFCFAFGLFVIRDSLSHLNIVLMSGLNLFQILVFNLMDVEQNVSVNVWVYIIFCVLFLIYSNQSNINYMMERRSHKLEHLPAKIRIYNLALISAVLTVVLLAFGFRNQIVSLLMRFFRLIRNILAYLLSFLQATETEEIPQEGMNATGESLGLEGGNTFIIWEILSYLVAILALVYIIKYLYSKRKEIAEWISNRINSIKKFLANIFKNTSIVDYFGEEEGEYKDVVVEVKHEGIFSKLFGKKYTINVWKKEYRKFTKMENNSEKFEYGYNLILNWLKLNKIKIDSSQTPWEVFYKTQNVIGDNNWEQTTENYNLMKYSNKNPSLKELENALKTITLK